MTRRFLPRLLAAAATLTGLVAVVTLFAGTGFAGSSAAQANYAPTAKTPPTISGSAMVGQTLTVSNGSWTYQATPTYTYQWVRCDTAGNGCSNLNGSTATTYHVGNDDLNHTIRVVVTAHNAQGTASSMSAQTAVVTNPGPQGAIKLPNGKTSIPATSVALPARLVIDAVQYQPRSVRGHAPFLARYHVSDTRGYVVRGALVYALGIPYAWITKGVEVQTDENGWATITITPSRKMPRRGALMMFVRARVAGQDLLAGTSSRRLSQILIR
ncbi:MAG TPA: hypothetical protein VFJ77_09390 [Gaiellaceae bacterium]|nr:hypothetical protein [Gaiellaceae bacterium]